MAYTSQYHNRYDLCHTVKIAIVFFCGFYLLSTFCNKAMAKQKFYFLRFDQKLICPRWVPNSYLSYILTGVLKKEHTF